MLNEKEREEFRKLAGDLIEWTNWNYDKFSWLNANTLLVSIEGLRNLLIDLPASTPLPRDEGTTKDT